MFDHRLRINASIYNYDYAGYQLSNPYFDFNLGQLMLELVNLPKVVNIGGEVEVMWRPTSNDRVTFAVAALESEIRESQILFGQDLKGSPLPNSPKLTFSGSYDHDFHLPNGAVLTPSLTVRYSSSYYLALPASAVGEQKAYWAEDASLSYQPDNADWSLTLYGKNLSDTVIKNNFISGNMSVGAPRTYGLTLTTRFH